MNIRSGLRHRKGAAFVAALAAASIIVFGGCSMGTAADNSVGEMQPAQQTADVSGLSEARNTPVVRAAKAVGPAVVGITNKAVARDWFNNPVETEGVGSGVIFRKDGYIVTNNHVVGGASRIQVTLADGRIYNANLTGTDSATDLAVIALENPRRSSAGPKPYRRRRAVPPPRR